MVWKTVCPLNTQQRRSGTGRLLAKVNLWSNLTMGWHQNRLHLAYNEEAKICHALKKSDSHPCYTEHSTLRRNDTKIIMKKENNNFK